MAQKKENAVASSEFLAAKQWLQKEQALRSEIVSLVTVPIAVEPRHVIASTAIVRLCGSIA